jgi:hypothetical protein
MRQRVSKIQSDDKKKENDTYTESNDLERI